MSLEYAILGFLAEHPRSGYGLKRRAFPEIEDVCWSADQAQIYRTLDRLENGKLVLSRRQRQSGRPDRRVFEITETGAEALSAWAREPQPIPHARDALLLHIFFADPADDEALLDILVAARAGYQKRLESLRRQAAATSGDATLSARRVSVRRMSIDGAIARDRITVDWLDDCIEEVSTGLPGGRRTGRRKERA